MTSTQRYYITFQEWARRSDTHECTNYEIKDDCLKMYNVRVQQSEFNLIAIPLHVIRGAIQVSYR